MSMEEKEAKLRKYMKPSVGTMFFLILLTAALLFFGIMILINLKDENTRAMWMTFAFLTALFDLLALYMFVRQKNQIKKCMKDLTPEDLTAAAEELEAFKKERKHNNAILGERFLFTKPAVIKYSDIIWAYPRIVRSGMIKASEALIINTPNMKELMVQGSNKKGVHDEIYTKCRLANPDVLIGFSLDNKKAYEKCAKEYRKAQKRGV